MRGREERRVGEGEGWGGAEVIQSFHVLQDGTWGVSYLVQEELRRGLEVVVCPPGYCQCHSFTEGSRQVCRSVYRYKDSDYQCKCNRDGEEWGVREGQQEGGEMEYSGCGVLLRSGVSSC